MATLIDSVGTQHYANKMVLAENRKVGSKSLPSALADVDKLIDEMKGQFEAEYGSALDMKLENDESVFSVGTGSGVDKSSEVENSFTNVEVFGNSMVSFFNLNYTTTSLIDIAYRHIGDYYPNIDLKPDIEYTLLPISSMNYTYSIAFFDGGEFGIGEPRKTNTFNKFIRRSGLKDGWRFRIYLHGNGANIPIGESFKFLLLEGDYTNKPLPQYFEGLKSVGEKEDRNEIEVLSRGRVLFSDYAYSHKPTVLYKGVECYEYSKSFLINHPIKPFWLKKGRKYRLSGQLYKNINNGQNQYFGFSFLSKEIAYGDEKQFAYYWGNGGHSNSIINVSEIQTCQHDIYVTKLTNINYGDPDNRKVYLVKGTLMLEDITDEDTKYPYEPHKSNKKQISLSEPLRGIADVYRDSITNIGGKWKLSRKLKQVTYDGNTSFRPYRDVLNDYYQVRIMENLEKHTNQYLACSDKLINRKLVEVNENPVKCFSHYTEGSISYSWIYLCLPYSELGCTKEDTTEVRNAKVKEWLEKNKPTIVYPIDTPTVEDIDPITLQCWKNGTISIDSTVPPTTTHTVALNKPAQIKRNIEELTTLRHKVKTLEEQYDQIALEQAHKLELLNHSFELDYNI